MDDILTKLYFGELRPREQEDEKSAAFRGIARKYDEADQQFQKGLTESQRSEYEQVKNTKYEYDLLYNEMDFRKGFQLGMQLAVAGLNEDKLKEYLKTE